LQFDGGAIAGVKLSRTSDVDDPRVNALPKLKTAIEVGAYAGLSYKGLTNPYDKLSLRLNAVKDVNGAHGDWVFTPSVDFSTPLSLKTFAGLSASIDIVGDDYADYYFGITPTDATLHPELTAYDPDGGIKSYTIGMLLGQSLEGTLLEGWSLFGTANYKRMLGDAADSPLVSDFGSRNQWFAAAGIGYTF
jgi:outer membrane scaffolding protein for murein synthesis (MipA/OmpV family)